MVVLPQISKKILSGFMTALRRKNMIRSAVYMKGDCISMKKFVYSMLTICLILGVFSGCSKEYQESAQMSIMTTTEATKEAITAPTAEVPTKSGAAETTGTHGVIRDIENADAVNIREYPGANYKVVTQLDEGTEVTVYEIITIDGGKEWGRIDQGWILMDLVQLNGG